MFENIVTWLKVAGGVACSVCTYLFGGMDAVFIALLILPLAYMRGRTLDNAFVILDEAQNTTIAQIKMFLTRMGRNARFIVTGDITQIDLPRRSDSGLMPVVEMLKGIDGIGIVAFDNRDIIRHRLVKHIVEAFERHAGNSEKE